MKFITSAIILASLYAKSWASGISAPLDNYGVVIPQWEVEVSPAGPTVLLNGTVEEVHAELLKLNPDWDIEYLPKKSSSRLAKRYDFSGAYYFCRDRWPVCSTDKIVEGIRYLRGVGGQPINGPGPGKCSRVSCSYNSAIWWCNDSAYSKSLGSFRDIADGALYLVDRCNRNGLVSGQVFTRDQWNVIVREDKC